MPQSKCIIIVSLTVCGCGTPCLIPETLQTAEEYECVNNLTQSSSFYTSPVVQSSEFRHLTSYYGMAHTLYAALMNYSEWPGPSSKIIQ